MKSLAAKILMALAAVAVPALAVAAGMDSHLDSERGGA